MNPDEILSQLFNPKFSNESNPRAGGPISAYLQHAVTDLPELFSIYSIDEVIEHCLSYGDKKLSAKLTEENDYFHDHFNGKTFSELMHDHIIKHFTMHTTVINKLHIVYYELFSSLKKNTYPGVKITEEIKKITELSSIDINRLVTASKKTSDEFLDTLNATYMGIIKQLSVALEHQINSNDFDFHIFRFSILIFLTQYTSLYSKQESPKLILLIQQSLQNIIRLNKDQGILLASLSKELIFTYHSELKEITDPAIAQSLAKITYQESIALLESINIEKSPTRELIISDSIVKNGLYPYPKINIFKTTSLMRKKLYTYIKPEEISSAEGSIKHMAQSVASEPHRSGLFHM